MSFSHKWLHVLKETERQVNERLKVNLMDIYIFLNLTLISKNISQR